MKIEDPYPFQRLLGFDKTEWSAEGCTVELDLTYDHGNRFGAPHGGLLASLLDTAMGYAACWTGTEAEQFCVTLSLTTNFIAPAGEGRLITRGWRVGGGRRIVYTDGEVRGAKGQLVANATGSFKLTKTIGT